MKNRKDKTKIKTFPVPSGLNSNQINTVNTNPSSKPSKEEVINKAFKLHSEGDIKKAAIYYQYCIKEGFIDHRVFINYGSILKDLGNLEEAEILTRKAIEIKPDFGGYYFNLGNILNDLGKLQDAELSIRKAINIKPIFPAAYLNLANILKELNKLKEAEIFIRKAIEIKPDYAEAHAHLGMILNGLGKLKDAEFSYRKAIEIKPDYFQAHLNLGAVLNDLGKLQEAEISTRKAIEIKPDFAESHFNLATILSDLKNLKESQLENQKGIDLEFIQNIDSRFKESCLKNLRFSKSQFRQDLFALSELNFKKNGFFVEFGSCDGMSGSNSYLLEKYFNWNGILAEPAVYWHKNLNKNRLVNIETKCVWKHSGDEILFNEPISLKQMGSIDDFSDISFNDIKKGKKYKVKTISLLDLLNKFQAPKTIDYLSIDTEGSEYEILKAFDFDKYKFRVITCEHNFTPMREKIYTLLVNKGYKRKLKTISRFDDWYVLAE